jgi:chromosome segregation ATPase
MKIELLSKDLLENRKQLNQLLNANELLKSQIAEKEGLNKVMKDKLADQNSLIKDLEQNNKVLEGEIDDYKKQIFAMENKMGAVEKRASDTDEHNQKVLYELMKHKELLKNAEHALATRDAAIEKLNAEQEAYMDNFRKSEDEKKALVVKTHSKKIAALNATITSLKTELDHYKRAINEKFRKESSLIKEFNDRMKEIILTKPDMAAIEAISTEVLSGAASSESSGPEESTFEFNADEQTEETISTPEEDVGGPSRVDEILPLIELAMDHGDNEDTIRNSLVSSGYTKKDIDEAFSKLSTVENE